MFYQKLTNLSAKKGMSVTRMAQELGLSNATATKWKSGSRPYYKTLLKIAKYLEVDVEFLLDDQFLDYDQWLSEVKGMTRVQYLGTINGHDKAEPKDDGLDEEFMLLARKLSAQQRQRVMDFMRGVLA